MIVDRRAELPQGFKWQNITPLNFRIPVLDEWEHVYTLAYAQNPVYAVCESEVSNIRDIGVGILTKGLTYPEPLCFYSVIEGRKACAPNPYQEPVSDLEVAVRRGVTTFQREFTGPDHIHGLGLPFHTWEQYNADPKTGALLVLVVRAPEIFADKYTQAAHTILDKRILPMA